MNGNVSVEQACRMGQHNIRLLTRSKLLRWSSARIHHRISVCLVVGREQWDAPGTSRVCLGQGCTHHESLQTPSFSTGLAGWECQCCPSNYPGLFPPIRIARERPCLVPQHTWGCCFRKWTQFWWLWGGHRGCVSTQCFGFARNLKLRKYFYWSLQLPSILLCLWILQDFSQQSIRSDISGSEPFHLRINIIFFLTFQLSEAISLRESNKCSLLFEDLPARWIQRDLVYGLGACVICFPNLYGTQTGFTVAVLFCLVELTHQIGMLPSAYFPDTWENWEALMIFAPVISITYGKTNPRWCYSLKYSVLPSLSSGLPVSHGCLLGDCSWLGPEA